MKRILLALWIVLSLCIGGSITIHTGLDSMFQVLGDTISSLWLGYPTQVVFYACFLNIGLLCLILLLGPVTLPPLQLLCDVIQYLTTKEPDYMKRELNERGSLRIDL